MATTEPGISPPVTASEVGRHLRTVRKAKGLSRSEVARSAGLTRRELAAYERGRIPVPDSDLWCLAGSCGVDVSELLPSRGKLGIGSDLGSLTVGDSVARLRAGASSDGLLREYLAMIYELRNLPPGTRPPMREEDLAALADSLGGTPDAIEARLHELIGVPRDEAARLRAMILPPRSLPAASATPLPDLSAYASTSFAPLDAVPAASAAAPPAPAPAPAPPPPAADEPVFDFAMASTIVGDPEATDRFFSAPLVDDPFASPPPLAPLTSLASAAPSPTVPTPAPEPTPTPTPTPTAFDPFAPPTAAPIDPFVSSDGGAAGTDAAPALPAPPAMPSFDPFAPAAPGAAAETPLSAAGTPTAFDLATFDPATFDATTFGGGVQSEPAIDDLVGHAIVADDGGVPNLSDVGDDPPFAVEVVALRPDEPAASTPEPAEMQAVIPVAVPLEESWIETWDTRSENGNGVDTNEADPFAALRIPLGEVFGAEAAEEVALDPFGPELGFDAPATAPPVSTEMSTGLPTELPTDLRGDIPGAPAEVHDELEMSVPAPADPEVDPFADAYRPLEATTAPPDVVLTPLGAEDDPDGAWFDRAAAATAALVADHLQAESEAEIDCEIDAEIEADADLDTEADLGDALVAAPIAGLAPISWSLFPPAVTPDTTEDGVVEDTETETAAGTDAQFVAAGTDWQVGGIFPATAMADDGTLALRRADVRWALADLVAGDDFTARATVDFTSGAGFGILFRVSIDDAERISGYSFDVDPIYGGGGFLLRQWHDNRQHWKPLAHAPVADPTRLYGHHTIDVQLRADQLTASVDGEVVLTVRQLSRCSIDSGREPCRGTRLGVQAWSTTEVTVDRLLLAD